MNEPLCLNAISFRVLFSLFFKEKPSVKFLLWYSDKRIIAISFTFSLNKTDMQQKDLSFCPPLK